MHLPLFRLRSKTCDILQELLDVDPSKVFVIGGLVDRTISKVREYLLLYHSSNARSNSTNSSGIKRHKQYQQCKRSKVVPMFVSGFELFTGRRARSDVPEATVQGL